MAKGLSPGVFLKALKANGILFLVSGRTERKAADALLAYSLGAAEEKEISGRLGWNLMGDGKWHYADRDEVTLMEVMRNAY